MSWMPICKKSKNYCLNKKSPAPKGCGRCGGAKPPRNARASENHSLGRFLCVVLIVFVVGANIGCRRPDTLFHIPHRLKPETLSTQITEAEKHYTLQAGDELELQVFANKGELMIDPNFELLKTIKRDINIEIRDQTYRVRGDGYVKLPLIEEMYVLGMRTSSLEARLSADYEAYYNDPFVLVRCVSRRVVVLGAMGGQVVRLPYEGATILEVLAQAGGFYAKGRARKVLLIRGDLRDPKVYAIDLSTVDGMRSSMIGLQPNDVLYVFPYRRDFAQSVNYVSLMAQTLTALLTLLWLLRGA